MKTLHAPVRALLPLMMAGSALAGCATVAADGGMADVAALTRARTGLSPSLQTADEAALAQQRQTLLRAPLGVDDAVRLALVTSPALQARYRALGVAQADLVQAGRLANPALGFKRTHAGEAIAIERTLTVNLVTLLTAPLARRFEGSRYALAKLELADAIEQHAHATRRAWYGAVAACQHAQYARQVQASADAGAVLMERMVQAGNASQLDLAREQAQRAEADAALARAERDAAAAREQLTRLLGLSGPDAAYRLPPQLPALPDVPAELDGVERMALAQRLDVQAARLSASTTAANLGLTRTTRFINVLDLGYVRNTPREQGYEITLELPLFDWGGARVARAEATYMQSLQEVAQVAVEARSQARQSYLAYRTAWDVAVRYRDQVIPLRQKVAREVLLRYNGMLAGPKELLADARDQAAAVDAYIGAMHDYWTAHADLEAAIGARVAAPQPNKEHAR